MDEQNMQNQVPSEPVAPSTPQWTPQQTTQNEQVNVVYASFLSRFLAALLDGILVGVAAGILGAIFGLTRTENGASYSNPFQLLGLIYYVFMDVKYGATLGKRVLGIRVQDADTGKNLTWGMAILREVVGKFISAFVLLLGYLWVLWDPKKQAWHDKLAKSIVVKVK